MRLAPATRRPWGSWWWSRSTAMPRTVHPRFRARSGTCKPMRIIVKLPQRPALKSRAQCIQRSIAAIHEDQISSNSAVSGFCDM